MALGLTEPLTEMSKGKGKQSNYLLLKFEKNICFFTYKPAHHYDNIFLIIIREKHLTNEYRTENQNILFPSFFFFFSNIMM
jgi:hypothetical protein